MSGTTSPSVHPTTDCKPARLKEHQTPTLLGMAPKVLGVIPTLLGMAPKVLGVIPTMLGTAPKVLGVIPTMLGMLPSILAPRGC